MKTIFTCAHWGRRRLNVRLSGLVYALECQGVKGWILKPFSQELSTGRPVPQRSITMFKNETVEPISYHTILQQLNAGENDRLLEDAVRLHRAIARKHDLIIVEGLVPK